jgi:NAD(P)-dependent dehydrogenase (short-subunit alcohol dehydrogenase family)
MPPRVLPSFSLENKVCVVTGAARGLGQQFLTAFALSGARGACIDLSLKDCEASIAATSEEVKAAYPDEPVPELRPYQCNVTEEAEVKATWAKIVEDFGRVDVLVTAAGICANIAAEKYEYEEWRRVMNVNLDGSWLFAREAGSHMLEKGIAGSIILIASVCAQKCVRPQKQTSYNASKSAVVMLAKTLGAEWGPKGIRVNSLSPGYMKTHMTVGQEGEVGAQLAETWVKDIPLGRIGDPDELRGTIVWMASQASSYLNGSDVVGASLPFDSSPLTSKVVDGGFTTGG